MAVVRDRGVDVFCVLRAQSQQPQQKRSGEGWLHFKGECMGWIVPWLTAPRE
jgi:hypothetical protein